MQFIYILPRWEGSATDGRILRDAITRRNLLKIPHGYYYLVDAGYTNENGFLAPYRGQRYHLNEWRDGYLPTNQEELFNMKHSPARNVIERCFGLLKMRWKILWNTYCYDISKNTDIITACALLHNLIRREMTIDPFEATLDVEMEQNFREAYDEGKHIEVIETLDQWTAWRDNLATEMFNS
ncbi:hypothetical protein GH714_034006 [Hevea brasiliensis]|uniref:DDE Tnp4 domain-containing protein n=1 Tax=Hevea brasiliensis TaxID=3981 RepID=A0A6A6L350_HEVBR|nr:hypothetical protein GH714_034006 [Hevea brasiliensis]